jgi:hypothetical protein
MAPKAGSWHVIQQGESAESVAVACGHATASLWDAPENTSLKQRRKSPHLLHPGDRLFVPAVEAKTFTVKTGQKAAFSVQRPPSRLKLQLRIEGKARANEPYVLEIDGVVLRGTTDGDGAIELPLSPLAVSAELVVGEGGAATACTLALRALDPLPEVSGVQGRLRNLGFGGVPLDGELGDETQAALCAFQAREGLEVSGRPDGPTCDKLEALHGG